MGTSDFSNGFKRDAVTQITERGYPVSGVSKRLGVSAHSLHARKKKLSKPTEIGGAKFDHGGGGIVLLRAA